jgi:outer membrane protein assembly factor BamB
MRWSVAVSARPAAMPVIGGDQIFIVLESGIVAAHRVSDGGETWHVELRTAQPVAVEGSRVFVAAGDAIHALDAASGAVAWVAPTGAVQVPMLVQDGWVIVASGSVVSALRAEDGMKIWSRDIGVAHARATIEGNNLYLPLENGHLRALELQTGNDRWTKPFAGVPSEVLAFSERIYVGSADKRFYCLQADDAGHEWGTRVGAVLRGRPVAEGHRIFITSIDNLLRAYDGTDGALQWHRSLPFRPAAPAVIGTSIVVSGNSAELHVFEAATGKPAGQIKLEQSLVMAPGFGTSAGAPVMAALIGSINEEWKLVLMAPPAPPPSVPLE